MDDQLTIEEQEFLDALDGQKCYRCGTYGSDVKYVADPYMEEIENEIVMVWLCEKCYDLICDDI